MTRGLLNLCTVPFPGPETIVSVTLLAFGSFTPASAGGRFKCELVALPRANEGSGEMAMVLSGRILISTTVVRPHFPQVNCTLLWTATSASFRTCCMPQLLQDACMN